MWPTSQTSQAKPKQGKARQGMSMDRWTNGWMNERVNLSTSTTPPAATSHGPTRDHQPSKTQTQTQADIRLVLVSTSPRRPPLAGPNPGQDAQPPHLSPFSPASYTVTTPHQQRHPPPPRMDAPRRMRWPSTASLLPTSNSRTTHSHTPAHLQHSRVGEVVGEGPCKLERVWV